MAYNTDYLSKIAYCGGKAGRRLFFYTTTDNAAAIAGSGYFADALDKGMEVGDVIIVTQVTSLPHTTPTGISMYLVTVVNATTGVGTAIKTATA